MKPPPLPQIWQVRDRILDLSARPLVMGIVNVTPDSFSDGGELFDPDAAVKHALEMVRDGADIIDIGGESTRPGAEPVGADEEIARVAPVIKRLSAETDIPISVDTSKSVVAAEAIESGAHIINDIGGLQLDRRIADVASATGAGLVLMHMRGTPRTMQRDIAYADLMGEIRAFLAGAVNTAVTSGVDPEAVVVDPGIGFGKSLAHNWYVPAHLHELWELGRPILIGTSRKRFLRELVGQERRDLEAATLATNVAACLHGAGVVRVHDVRSHAKAMVALGEIVGCGAASDIQP